MGGKGIISTCYIMPVELYKIYYYLFVVQSFAILIVMIICLLYVYLNLLQCKACP